MSTRLGNLNVSSFSSDFGHCEQVVKEWVIASLDDEVKEDRQTLKDLLFFLHIPRTAGCAFVDCFLLRFYPMPLQCLHPFDIQNDPSKKGCRLMASHDDYSVNSKLPKDKTSTVTILRNPVDRVLSIYEFTMEVAARFLVFPNQSSASLSTAHLHPRNGVATMHVWPWKYLVPWMREDLFARSNARKLRGTRDVKIGDPYSMEEMTMPLLEYINDRVVHDIVHNGATFQIAGLTNNSHLMGAHEVRHCVQTHKTLEEHVLQVAKRKLDNMLYIGLAEDLREAIILFRNVVGAQVISQIGGTGNAASRLSEQDPSFSNSELYHQMSIRELMEAYDACNFGAQKRRAFRRNASLKVILPVNFTKEARRKVPDFVIQQIKSLNNLDMELYKYAQVILAKEHKEATTKLPTTERLAGYFKHGVVIKASRVLLLAVPFFLIFFFFHFVSAIRSLKVKNI